MAFGVIGGVIGGLFFGNHSTVFIKPNKLFDDRSAWWECVIDHEDKIMKKTSAKEEEHKDNEKRKQKKVHNGLEEMNKKDIELALL